MIKEILSFLRSFCWMIPMLILLTSVMGLLSLLSSLIDSQGTLQHRIACAWGRQLTRLFLIPTHLYGSEQLDPNQPYVFVSNHFSLIDTPMMFGLMPRPFRILARAGLWKIPFIGWHLDRAGHLPVSRSDARQAVRNIASAAEHVRAGYSILLFPEGGRTRGEVMRTLKSGAAHIAIQSGAPIVPMALLGTRKILPPGSFHLRPGIAELRIGTPILTSGLTRPMAKSLMEQVRQEILRLRELPDSTTQGGNSGSQT